jgi:hypothetical protein
MNTLNPNFKPSLLQQWSLDIVKVCEQNRTRFAPGSWDARALRDFATTCFLLPQRSGKTMLTHMAADEKDVIVFSSTELLEEHASHGTPGVRAVGFDSLPCLKDTPRLWVTDAFWTGLLKGPDDNNTEKVYAKIAHASSHNYVSIILIDSPF